MFPTCYGRQAAVEPRDWGWNSSTAQARPAFHGAKKKHFGMQGLLPSTAIPSPLNISAWVNQVFPPKHASECHTLLGSPEELWNPQAASEERHVRPRHSVPQAAPAHGQHLAAITRPAECGAAIFGTEEIRREQTGHYLHIKGSHSPRHHRKAAWQTSTLGNLWGDKKCTLWVKKSEVTRFWGQFCGNSAIFLSTETQTGGFLPIFSQPCFNSHTHTVCTLGLLQKLSINHSF